MLKNNTPTQSRHLKVLLALTGLLGPCGALHAQATAPNSLPASAFPEGAEKRRESAKESADDPIALSVFEVRTDRDTSYGALHSNSLTRFNVELAKLPVSADILTESFINDVGATNIRDLLQNYGLGTGATGANDSFATTEMRGDRANVEITVRGLRGGGNRQNGMMLPGTTSALTQNYNVERVEVVRGPQALLYGAGGAGGVVNVITKQARFNSRSGNLTLRLDDEGSKFLTGDYNFGSERVALRVAGQTAEQAYPRAFLGGPIKGGYVQLAVKPVSNTVLRFNYDLVRTNLINGAGFGLQAPGNVALGIPRDPRHNVSSRLLVYRDGASDIANGHFDSSTMDSFRGEWAQEKTESQTIEANAETRWTKWFSTQLSGALRETNLWNATPRTLSGIWAPGHNTSPTSIAQGARDHWSIGFAPGHSYQWTRRKAARISGVLDFPLLGGKARNQTLFGADYWTSYNAQYEVSYYEVDAAGNWVYSATIPPTTALPLRGRIDAPPIWYIVDDGPKKYPIPVHPFASQYVDPNNGKTYRVGATSDRFAHLVSSTNPAGFSGGGSAWRQYQRSGGLYLAQLNDWFSGRLTTLGGARFENSDFGRWVLNQTVPPEFEAKGKPKSYNLGINYRVADWLRTYYSYSTSYNLSSVIAAGPAGELPQFQTAKAHEVGVKLFAFDNKVTGNLAYYTSDMKSDQVQIQQSFYDAINPAGLNGRLSPSGPWAILDRDSSGYELAVTAEPSKRWRSRLAVSVIDAEVKTTKVYDQMYNDEFYTDGKGGVTFKDGAPFMVPVTPGDKNGPKTQLTLAMLKGQDANKGYIAQFDPESGRITNLGSVFPDATADDVAFHGGVKTERTGLPITAHQLYDAWGDPNGHKGKIPVAYAGERSSGFAKYQFTWTNNFSFTEGKLKGLRLGGTVIARMDTVGYYYNNVLRDGTGKAIGFERKAFMLPDTVQFDPSIAYSRKLGRYSWTTQINAYNVFNHYKVQFTKDAASGTVTGARLTQNPRFIMWSNSINF